MTYPPDQPFRGNEYPALEAPPLDYPGTYPQYPVPQQYPAPQYPAPPYPPPYPGYGPYDPYGYPPRRNTNGMAVTSFVVSLVGLIACGGVPGPLGLILGIIAMRETKRSGDDGYGFALAGTIIGAVCTVGWVLVVLVYVGLFGVFFATVAAQESAL